MNRTSTPGRPAITGTRADQSVRIPLTADEMAWIDARRGQTPRATWIRARLFEMAEAPPVEEHDLDAWREGVDR